MKIGIGGQLWLRDNHTESFPRMLDDLALLGYDGFECCYPFLIEWYEDRPEDLRRLLKMHGLEFASYYTGISFERAVSRERGVEEFKRRCRFMAALGSQTVLLDGGGKAYRAEFASAEDYIQVIARTANELGVYAQSLGLTLAWHQHWGSLFDDEAHFNRLLALTDPSVVGVCLDTAQVLISGFDLLATVRRNLPRIRFMHYKDAAPNTPPRAELWPGKPLPGDPGAYEVDSRWRMVELGRGKVPFREVTDLLLGAGYNGWLMDDFDYSGYPAYTSAKACKEFINHGLGVWGERDANR